MGVIWWVSTRTVEGPEAVCNAIAHAVLYEPSVQSVCNFTFE